MKSLDRHHAHPKRTQVPAQVAIPSKTINQHRWRDEDISRQIKIYTKYDHKPSTTTNYRWKIQYNEGIYTLVQTRNLLNKKTKEEKDTDTSQPTKVIIARNRNNYSLISININGLNSTMKRQRLSDWINKQNPAVCCIQETHLRDRQTLSKRKWMGKKLRIKQSQEASWSGYFNIE